MLAPSLRDHLTDDVGSFAFLPLVAAAAPAIASMFGKKKKKKKPAPPPKQAGISPTMMIIGGVGLVGVIAMFALTRSPSKHK